MSDYDLDALLDDVVLGAALEHGRDLFLAARQFGAARVIAAANRPAVAPAAARTPREAAWTPGETAWLARWSGVLGEAELAARLGRTPMAVDTRQSLMGLPRATTHPGYMTGLQIAAALGVDGHAVVKLIGRGVLAVERAPLDSNRLVWRVGRTAFYAWAVNPLNWVYFWRSVQRPERLGDAKLRRLVEARAARWLCADGRPNAWWTPGEAAAYHGVGHIDINRYIRHGRLPGVKWGNWWVLRSDATRPGFRVYRIEDGRLRLSGTPDMDAFLVLAFAVGIPSTQVSRLVGGRLADSGAWTRHKTLVARGFVPWLAEAYGLPVRERDGLTWADWRDVAHRFPHLARVWADLRDGRPLNRPARGLLSGVLAAFLRFHGLDTLRLGQGDASAARLREAQRIFEDVTAAGAATGVTE